MPDKPVAFLDLAEQDPDIGPLAQIDEDDKCPECQGDLMYGHGLMGGGLGTYALCTQCDWMAKDQDEIDEQKEEGDRPRST